MEKPFFNPWIGNNYHKGLNNKGIKVMVLGASHYCDAQRPEEPIDTDQKKQALQRYKATINCPFRSEDKCMGNSAKYEKKCPCPENGDITSPSQADTTTDVIEEFLAIESTKIKDNYQRTFNFFHSSFVPDLNHYIEDPQERRGFWNSVIFYNYYQDFRKNAHEGWFDSDRAEVFFKPFANLVEEHKPDVIFCWGKYVRETMKRLANLKLIEDYIFESTVGSQHPIIMFIQHPSFGFSYNGWYPYVKRVFIIAKQRSKSYD